MSSNTSSDKPPVPATSPEMTPSRTDDGPRVDPGQPDGKEHSRQHTFLQKLLERAALLGHSLWGMLGKRRFAAEQLVRGLPNRLRKTANQISLALELTDDYRSGVYRDIPWSSIAVAIAGVVYVVSPVDLIPVPIPFLGSADDVLVMSLVMRFLRADLERYCSFKGYNPADYFD